MSCKELLESVEGSLQNIIIEMNVKLVSGGSGGSGIVHCCVYMVGFRYVHI